MAIAQSELLRARQRRPLLKSQVRAGLQKTAFLCHSHRDDKLAEGLQALLAEQGVELYIDWKDASMPPEPNRETASRIQHRIKTCDWFLFLATANSMASRWCPWELGYADGQKQPDRIAIVQTSDSTTTHGNEYMRLFCPARVSSTTSFIGAGTATSHQCQRISRYLPRPLFLESSAQEKPPTDRHGRSWC